MQKRLFLLFGALGLASLGIYLVTDNSDTHERPQTQINSPNESFAGNDNEPEFSAAQQASFSADMTSSKNMDESEQALALTVTGISYTNEPELRIAIIEYASEKHEYRIADVIAGTAATIKDILPESVMVEYNGKLTEYRLSYSSSTDSTVTIKAPTTAIITPPTEQSEIGNRPRELNHIVAVPEGYTPGSRLFAAPGLNPKLFKSAGLQEGDEILSINDLDFSLAELFDDIQDEIKSAHTLKFEVLRGGRKVIIYLDIPSETPKIK